MKNNIGQYDLIRLSADQWQAYKDIRLEALQAEPGKFGSNYAKESNYSDQEWSTLLENDNRAIFGLYHQSNLVGLTGVALFYGDHSKALLFSSYIKPEHRGKGVSTLFYEERMAWARQKNCRSILVSHRAGNEASKAANQRFGFVYTHSEKVTWPDGSTDDELMYSLDI
ncbi:GNAT family N-acetyltransferase [Sphingobacterium faecale]|uniref:GNAT family N-acetyltransferase n=1 Tax=Sphingobacterium faecale TaxID=2803775 RepID=A0ABS1R1D5_9SPHI|nr:GNAT family N-acetyltransferase [Sphingobacterium faecale]MBL1408496.1 GNAT family N-acetyltransferase [Sphingobacterium faecale]